MSNFYNNKIFTPFNFAEIYEIGENLEITSSTTLADALKDKAPKDGVFVGAYVLVRATGDNTKYDQSVWMKALGSEGLYYKQIADLNLPEGQWSKFYDDAVEDWNGLKQDVNNQVKSWGDAVAAAAALPIGKGTGENAVAQTDNIASGINSFAEGAGTKATANYAHAEGYATEASHSCAHAEGDATKAAGPSSHAGGQYSATTDLAHAAFAHGVGVVASQQAQAVFGKYNNDDTDAAFIIGNGNKNEVTGIVTPSNLFVVKNNGEVEAGGKILQTQFVDVIREDNDNIHHLNLCTPGDESLSLSAESGLSFATGEKFSVEALNTEFIMFDGMITLYGTEGVTISADQSNEGLVFIHQVADPINDDDAANKDYVDRKVTLWLNWNPEGTLEGDELDNIKDWIISKNRDAAVIISGIDNSKGIYRLSHFNTTNIYFSRIAWDINSNMSSFPRFEFVVLDCETGEYGVYEFAEE